MRTLGYILLLSFFQFLYVQCTSQEQKVTSPNQDIKINRKPAVAGQFYPSDKNELLENLEGLFEKAEPRSTRGVAALISPHAGYVFSGQVAASAFNQLDPATKFENVFILASSHRTYYEGGSVYYIGNYLTPLGEVEVNTELAKKIASESKYFSYVPEAHVSEHSLEVQLPFLQYIFKENLKIVPIVIGTQSAKVCKEMASVLKPYFNESNLFVISSDFSHYPSWNEANYWDQQTADAILQNSPEAFLNTIKTKDDDNIPNLSTRVCGWTSILTLLYLTEGSPDYAYEKIIYKNSGDTPYGDKMKVVGYNAIAIYKKTSSSSQEFKLEDNEKKELLVLARKTMTEYITGNKLPEPDPSLVPSRLLTQCGAFVTLHKDHNLRGCIGRFTAEEPLYKVVQEMSIASSTQDRRFLPVTPDELKDIELEISVLSPMKKIQSIEEIVLGKHGIYIKKGNRSGTFLPQVATETGWNLEEFLGHCSRDKAGLGWEGWKDAEVYIYEALVFSEKDFE
jgi:AmmeMemoRadiSam system protein B/AmmeMemoRadiSam system protein A